MTNTKIAPEYRRMNFAKFAKVADSFTTKRRDNFLDFYAAQIDNTPEQEVPTHLKRKASAYAEAIYNVTDMGTVEPELA